MQAGINIVLKALEAPIRQIAENSGVEGSIVVGKIMENKSETFGFDAQTEEYVDMVDKGIIDPAKVVRARAAGRGLGRGPAGDHRSHGRRGAEEAVAGSGRCRAAAAWAEWTSKEVRWPKCSRLREGGRVRLRVAEKASCRCQTSEGRGTSRALRISAVGLCRFCRR